MSKRADGFVLLTVIWVLAILTVLTLGFGHRVMLDQRAAALSIDQLQAQCMARGAVEHAMGELRNQAFYKHLARLEEQYNPNAQPSKPFPACLGEVNLLDKEQYFSDEMGGEGDECRCIVEDEERRISVSAAPEEMLDEVDALSFTTVNEIVRRREREDTNVNTRPFLALEEVRLLDGVTERAWFGQGDKPGLCDLLSVYGDGLINVNTASEDVLRCIPDLDEDVVSAIIAYRDGKDGEPETDDDQPFISLGEIAGKTGTSPDKLAPLAKYCKVESQFFRITGFATRRSGIVSAKSEATVRVVGARVLVLQWREGALGS